MAGQDGTYPNSKVGLEQGSIRFFIDADGYFNVAGSDLTGAQLKSMLYDNLTPTVIANSAGVLSTINLPAAGIVVFSIADAASNASAWLTSGASIGQTLTLYMRGVGSTGSIYISMSGVTLIGKTSGELSSISLQNSAASAAYVKLVATADGTWSIMDIDYDTVVQRGAS